MTMRYDPPMPKGEIPLMDGRILRPIIGYDVRQLAKRFKALAYTVSTVVESCGWKHEPSGLTVTATRDQTQHGTLLHIAASYYDHDPAWPELKELKAIFFGADCNAMIVLPKQELYVNLHNHCFHIWQMPTEWGIM